MLNCFLFFFLVQSLYTKIHSLPLPEWRLSNHQETSVKKKKAQNKFGLLGRLARRNNIRDFFNTILK